MIQSIISDNIDDVIKNKLISKKKNTQQRKKAKLKGFFQKIMNVLKIHLKIHRKIRILKIYKIYNIYIRRIILPELLDKELTYKEREI